jgi:phage tail-like protein
MVDNELNRLSKKIETEPKMVVNNNVMTNASDKLTEKIEVRPITALNPNYTVTTSPSGNGPVNHIFRIEIDGIEGRDYLECTGLGSSVEVIPYCSNTDPTVRKLPGRANYSEIRITWSVNREARHLYNWYRKSLDGNPERRNASIVLVDKSGNELVRWNLTGVWPCAYEGPYLSVMGTDLAYESLTLVCERMDRVE